VKGFRLLQHYLINPNCGASEKKAKSKKCIDKTVKKEKNKKPQRRYRGLKERRKRRNQTERKKTITSLIIFMKLYVCGSFSPFLVSIFCIFREERPEDWKFE